MLKRLIRRAVRMVVRVPAVARLLRSELPPAPPRPRKDSPAPRQNLPATVFIDRYGVRHQLDDRLRDQLKPGWRTMFDESAGPDAASPEVRSARLAKARASVAEARTIVRSVTGTDLGGRILEVGCYDGAVTWELTRATGTTAVGSDLARYYVIQRPGEPADHLVTAQQATLAALREAARVAAGMDARRVRFVEDDITASTLEPDSFDAIVSFEVLEHLLDPAAAFEAMFRLVRPGGVVYHDYNPFYAVNGGHSLCTLDFPWGHARLDVADVARYVDEIRPAERDQALRFLTESLNRMALADLRAAVTGAGFELLAVLPWLERGRLASLAPEVLDEVRRLNERVGLEDLLATFVSVVARRPESPVAPA